jgi:protein SCO1
MKKRPILTVALLVVLLTSAGISFFLIRDATAKIPDDIWFITHEGKEYHFADSEKKIKVLEFMYMNCPEVCPTTTQKMVLLKNDLEKEGVFGEKVQFISITLNLYDDTPEQLRAYMKNFQIKNDGNWIFLTGDKERIYESSDNLKEITKKFSFFYNDPGDGYYVHSSFVYIIDEDNQFVKKFPMGADFDKDDAFKKIMKEL